MVVRMRVTKSKRNQRRSHHKLSEPRLSKCSNCGAMHLRHRMCPECGYYRGKMVVDIVAEKEKKLAKKAKREQALSQSESENKEEK